MAEQEVPLWDLVREDYEAHGRQWSRAGFLAIAVHRFGVWRMQIRPRAMRLPFSVSYRVMNGLVTNLLGIEVPYTAQVGRRVVFEHQHGIVVHGATVIGDDCVIRQGVTLGLRRMTDLDEAPVLGDGVDVGAGAKLLGRVQVGDGAVIGANAVVLEDVPAGALAVGVPAQIRKARTPLHAVEDSEGVRRIGSVGDVDDDDEPRAPRLAGARRRR